jgi:hypothetical protein
VFCQTNDDTWHDMIGLGPALPDTWHDVSAPPRHVARPHWLRVRRPHAAWRPGPAPLDTWRDAIGSRAGNEATPSKSAEPQKQIISKPFN